MHRSTAFFLILLRLVIGWHFLFEGLQKIQSVAVGETFYSKPFSSAGYFREAPGPFGSVMRMAVGDPDREALARLKVVPLAEDAEPATDRPQNRMPPGLKRDWADYLRRFTAHYDLDAEQKTRAEAILEQNEARVVQMLSETSVSDATKEITRSYPSGDVKRRVPMATRIWEYQAAVENIQEMSGQKAWAFGRDVEGARLRQAKADRNRLRSELLGEVDEETDTLKKDLAKILTAEQKDINKPVPPAPPNKTIVWIDWLTRWSLTVIGACLLIGLFTRLNALLAAGFLLMTYLAVPAWPWLPSVGPSEGNYLFVNKNLIEFFALCVLATTYTGRWFGVDAILHAIGSALFGSGKSDASQSQFQS